VEEGVWDLNEIIRFIATAGLIGAAATFILEAVGKYTDRRRELRGLLRMLRIEVSNNNRLTESFLKDPKRASNYFWYVELGFTTWERTIWENNGTRIAQGVPQSDFQKLAYFYEQLSITQMVHTQLLAMQQIYDSPEEEDQGVIRRRDLLGLHYTEEDLQTAYNLLGLQDLEQFGNDAVRTIDKHL
jgi:hypothetical protein